MKIRTFWVLIHRYVGLTMALFLIIVGLTGSLLAFYDELDALFNPQFTVATDNSTALDPAGLLEIAAELDTGAVINGVWFKNHTATVSVEPAVKQQANAEAAYDQLILNAHNGKLLGKRQWGDLAQGKTNILPFIYKLHDTLALGDVGLWLLGIMALLWTLDCFVGFYLTLPPGDKLRKRQSSENSKTFWSRWKPAWLIKWTASTTRINFDLHRASGLWLWLALLVFAWSSVFMNLSDIYNPIMQTLTEYHEPWIEFPDRGEPLTNPKISWRQAQEIGLASLKELSETQHLRLDAPSGFWINRAKGFYVYSIHSSADIQQKGGQTRVVIDADSGAVKQVLLATGQYNGNTLTTWLMTLHMANIWGLPYRIFVCVLGLVISLLSVTGVLIWMKKRQSKTAYANQKR